MFAAYEEVAPAGGGLAERVELYQLLPLLVHAVLFGGSYRAAAERIARRYAGDARGACPAGAAVGVEMCARHSRARAACTCSRAWWSLATTASR